jgi:hypothetical protein
MLRYQGGRRFLFSGVSLGFSGFLCGFSVVSLRFLCDFYNPEKQQRNTEKHRETTDKPQRNQRETREKLERNPEKPQRTPKDRATHTPGEANTNQVMAGFCGT